jgi:hypothetical protein
MRTRWEEGEESRESESKNPKIAHSATVFKCKASCPSYKHM